MFVDIQTIQHERHADRGIPRFTIELSRALLAGGTPVGGLALNPLRPYPRHLHPELAHAPELVWNTAETFRRAASRQPLTYVVTSSFEDTRPAEGVLAPHVRGVPRVAVVYDLIPEVLGYVIEEGMRRYRSRRAWVRAADRIVTISEHTRLDVIERWDIAPERVSVIGAAPAPFFTPASEDDDPMERVRRTLPAIKGPFVLTVSAWLWHKNLESLIDAWARLRRRRAVPHQLVVAGNFPREGYQAVGELARAKGLGDDAIVLTGFVPDKLLRDLYRATALFVLASYYEGYGLPVAEAVACGVPALTSDASSLPEVIGWSPGAFPPGDPELIAERVEQALTDAAYRVELVAACRAATGRHTWPDVARRLVDACAALDPGPWEPSPTRIAIVGPFPPRSSRRAVANGRLAALLADGGEVDCFVEYDPAATRAEIPGAVRTFPARSLGPIMNPAAYDAIVYTIGAGYESVDTRRAALRYPGIVVGDDDAATALVPDALATVVAADPERAAATVLDLAHAGPRPSTRRRAVAATAG